MMLNLRTVWPFRPSRPRATTGHKIFCAILFAPLLIPAAVVSALPASRLRRIQLLVAAVTGVLIVSIYWWGK